MTLTFGEMAWLGSIAAGAVIGIIGGAIEMRRPGWKRLPATARRFHVGSLVSLAAMFAAFATVWIRTLI